MILEIEGEATMFISDRDKGLEATDDKLGDKIIRVICAYYLIDNFIIRYSYILNLSSSESVELIQRYDLTL